MAFPIMGQSWGGGVAVEVRDAQVLGSEVREGVFP